MAPQKAPAGQNASQGVVNQAVVIGIQKDALKRSSAVHPTNQQAAAVTHLVPPGSLPPHPPQSFNHMLPHHQQYDAYMCPTSTDPKLEPLDTRDTPSESDAVLIDPAIQEQDTNIEQMPPPPAKFNQFAPTKKSLATSAPSNNPFDVFTTGTRLESASPMLTTSSLTLLDALTTPSCLSSVAPQLSASNRHISATPTKSIVSTHAAVVIPKWLTDTIRCLKNDVKSHKEKLEETKDLLQEQTVELNELRQLIATLHNDQTQLGEDIDKTRISLDSVHLNIDVITKSLEGSGEPSKVKVAHAAVHQLKTGVRKTFLKAIGVMKTDDNILKCLHEIFKHYTADYHTANKLSLITRKAKGKIDPQTKSDLTSMEWDFAFTLPYQSTDESVQSEDNHGGIDPDTDEEKDLHKKPAKVKGKRKAHPRKLG
ncbi:uncharacterized protein BJ212DRAFT_1298510 [Suillus subaureus]|uniref:Uncharacterized protein n=1 Tax=Suillus subaureus TaxID=48587 RepID=A0A9P7EF65_9AGAM|nr:uncharacterized protein BJ212DRAFT_1298510 [Suillus subaureus]KAG1819285.1 hypothetical protein BJ212DRAFT_1298510 [Suillus subaureus]